MEATKMDLQTGFTQTILRQLLLRYLFRQMQTYIEKRLPDRFIQITNRIVPSWCIISPLSAP